jgi:hypothetical protein
VRCLSISTNILDLEDRLLDQWSLRLVALAEVPDLSVIWYIDSPRVACCIGVTEVPAVDGGKCV